MKLAHKTLLMPMLAAVAFLVIHVVITQTRRTHQALEIEYISALRLGVDLTKTVDAVQRIFENSAKAGDGDGGGLAEIDRLGIHFASLVERQTFVAKETEGAPRPAGCLSACHATAAICPVPHEERYKRGDLPITSATTRHWGGKFRAYVSLVRNAIGQGGGAPVDPAAHPEVTLAYRRLRSELERFTLDRGEQLQKNLTAAHQHWDASGRMVTGTIALGMLVIVLFSFFLGRSFTAPILASMGFVTAVSKGDLRSAPPRTHRRDEIGQLVTAMDRMREGLTALIRRVSEQTTCLNEALTALSRDAGLTATTADNLHEQAQHVAGATAQQSDSLNAIGERSEELATLMTGLAEGADNITSQINAIAVSAEEASASVARVALANEQMSTSAATASSASTQISKSMAAINSAVEELSSMLSDVAASCTRAKGGSAQCTEQASLGAASMVKLGESSLKIGEIVGVIRDIAEQTNMLALNATIEAARAGEAGAGFAVVAREIKDLARQTAEATAHIAKQIKGMQDDCERTVLSIEEIASAARSNEDVVAQIAGSVGAQKAMAEEIATSISQAALAAEELSRGSADARKVAVEIAHNSGEAAKGGEEIALRCAKLARAAASFSEGVAEASNGIGDIARSSAEVRQGVLNVATTSAHLRDYAVEATAVSQDIREETDRIAGIVTQLNETIVVFKT